MNISNSVNILGTEYKIILTDKNDSVFSDGCDMGFVPETKEIFMAMEGLNSAEKELMFTTCIIRAFLFESGFFEEKIQCDYDIDIPFTTTKFFLKIQNMLRKFDKKRESLTKVNILGTKYRISYFNRNCFTDFDSCIIPLDKKIMINIDKSNSYIRESVVHELFNAFLLEMGLDYAWICDSYLPDWFMIQFTKIEKVVNMLK